MRHIYIVSIEVVNVEEIYDRPRYANGDAPTGAAVNTLNNTTMRSVLGTNPSTETSENMQIITGNTRIETF